MSAVASPSPIASPAPLDPRALTDPADIAAQLAALTRREAEVTLALNALISDRAGVDGALAHLASLAPHIDALSAQVDGAPYPPPLPRSGSLPQLRRESQQSLGLGPHGFGAQQFDEQALVHDSEGLVARVAKVYETSERVGGKVRRLDDEIGRVRESADVVTEVLELKNSLANLRGYIEKHDWENAARACRRAMDVRPDVLNGGFAATVVPTTEAPLPPPQQLAELRQVLLTTFRAEFELAADRRDEQEISRYFRLWPGIGAEDEGLAAYGDFVVELVKSRSRGDGKPSSPLYYLSQLTSLLEAIAHIIDQHQPVIDKYYGKGRMGKVVARLVRESDRVVQRLVEGWEEQRKVGRLVSETRASAFPLLSNPALLPPLFPSLASTAGQLSLAGLANTTSNISSALQSYAPRVKGGVTPVPTPVPPEEDAGPDARDVDRILGELVALGGRWALFRRFIFSRLREDADVPEPAAAPSGAPAGEGTEPAAKAEKTSEGEGEPAAEGEKKPELDERILTDSLSQKAMENLLRVYYAPLEAWYLRTAVEKAHKLDQADLGSRPLLSSVLDDVFYLVKIVLTRALSSGSLPALATMRERAARILERDYVDVLARKMEGVFAAGGGGGYDRAERERRERDQRTALTVYLNDLEQSAAYVERLLSEWRAGLPQVWDAAEVPAVLEELEIFGDLAMRFRLKCKAGLDALFANILRPRLRALLDETYRDVSYVLSEDEFADAEERDAVRRRFVRLWTALTEEYKAGLSEGNFHALFALLLEALARPWERLAMGMQYSDFGAVRFERDIKNIANFLNNQTSFGLNVVREKMTRLNQVALVLNFDADELADIDNVGVPWRLSKNEIGQVLELRV